MADEFGNYIIRGHREPDYITNARQIIAHEQNYALMSPENRVYVKQGLRLLYYCMTNFLPGVESALREGADPNFTKRGINDEYTAFYLLMNYQRGHADERLRILQLLFEHGFKPKDYDTNIQFLNRALRYASNLVVPPDFDEDLDEALPEIIDIKNALAAIILKYLPVTEAEINKAFMSNQNKQISLSMLRKIKSLPQVEASQQIDMLHNGLQTRANPFHAQGTRDTIMDYVTGTPYLSKEQRSMLIEDMPRGGKRSTKKRRAIKRRTAKSRATNTKLKNK